MFAKIIRKLERVLDDVENEKRRKILKWLGGNSNTRYEELRNETVENSGQWFLNSDEFKTWADGIEPSCLWCVGIRSPFSLSMTDRPQTEQERPF